MSAVMTCKVIVITSCTSRKRVASGAIALTAGSMRGSLTTVAEHWTRRIRNAPVVDEAQHIYMGRGFAEAKLVASGLGAPLHVVSAGLGVISATDAIPVYDLTVADGGGSLKPLLSRLGKEPRDWWAALTSRDNGKTSVQTLLDSHPNAVALIALPGTYISLIVDDLLALTPRQVAKVRIITSEHGRSLIPEQVRRVALPYDERLEGSTYAGTRADFPQRALRHFVEALDGHRLSLSSATIAVTNAMAILQKPIFPVRARKSDEEILVLMRDNWSRFEGSSGRMLRFLRDEAHVSCEQSRFRDLWKFHRRTLLNGE